MNIEFASYVGDADDIGVAPEGLPLAAQTASRQVSVYAETIADAGENGDEKFFDIVLNVTTYDEANMTGYRTFKIVKRISLIKSALADQAAQNTDVTVLESSAGGFLDDPKTLARFKQLAGV